MKVLFLIYSHGPATGGHFHSLDTLSGHLASELSVGIVSIGSNPSPVLAANRHFSAHISYGKGTGYLSFLQALRKTIAKQSPDVVHCFDAAALCLSAPVIGFGKYKVVLNKCGGPNPIKNRWVFCSNIIFFSLENYEWFMAAEFYRKASLHLVPNRVEELKPESLSFSNPVKDTSKFNLVRITRISPDYWHTMQLAVKAAAFFGSKRPVKLYVIGRVYDRKVHDDLIRFAADCSVDLEVITDERANKAVKMLYLADAVVGTGRSIMEAMSFGLPVMAPALNCELPVLINESNFDLFFRLNFSERVSVTPEMAAANTANLLEMGGSDAGYRAAGAFSKDMFNRYFNVTNAVKSYRKVYESANPADNFSILRLNGKYIAREIINAGKR